MHISIHVQDKSITQLLLQSTNALKCQKGRPTTELFSSIDKQTKSPIFLIFFSETSNQDKTIFNRRSTLFYYFKATFLFDGTRIGRHN